MATSKRVDRFSQQVQREIAQIIQREIKDPRVVFPTVSSVNVSRDLSYARVYMTFMQDDEETVAEALAVLNDASGYIRSLLGKKISSRVTPNLQFLFDASTQEGMRMSSLVQEARQADEQKHARFGTEPEDDILQEEKKD